MRKRVKEKRFYKREVKVVMSLDISAQIKKENRTLIYSSTLKSAKKMEEFYE